MLGLPRFLLPFRMDQSGERGDRMRVDSAEMLRQAIIMATRLAAGRYARPIFFLSDRPPELRSTLLRIWDGLSSLGHDAVIVEEPRTAFAGTEALCVRTTGSSNAHLLLIPEVHELDQRALARMLDGLHLIARDGLTAGCIATGSPETPRIAGGLRSFAERLIEFRRASI